MLETACGSVVLICLYVGAVTWSIGKRVHRVLDHLEKRVEPPQQPIQLRANRWGR